MIFSSGLLITGGVIFWNIDNFSQTEIKLTITEENGLVGEFVKKVTNKKKKQGLKIAGLTSITTGTLGFVFSIGEMIISSKKKIE
ncbi:MAG: hypothetical protein ACRC4M_05610 [Mycoplasma sp.]